jgi:PAS domain S-box-containing protein
VSTVSISELVMALEDGASLRDALARALADESLTLYYWIEQRHGKAGGGWVDADGRPVAQPSATPGRSVTVVEENGARLAAILHDAALDAQPELLDAVTAAARLTIRSDRLQAELRAEVAYINTVTDTAPSLLSSINIDGTIRNVNAAATRAAGYSSREEVVGRHYWDVFIDPSERADMIERFEALAPDFEPGEYENEFVNARGERRIVYWRTAPLRDENGMTFAIVSGGVDITERRERERELEREQEVQQRVFETMPSIMVALAVDGTIRDRDDGNPQVGANRAFRDAIRWPDHELVGRSFLDLVVEDEDGRAARALDDAAAGRTSGQVESDLRSKDGTARRFAWSAIPIADVTGRMERLVLVCGADITERTALAAANERERAFLYAIANHAPSLLLLIEPNGRLIENGANIAFERTLGFRPAEIGGQIFWDDFVDPSEADEARRIIESVAAGGAPEEHDHTWITRAGALLSVAWTCTPLPVIDEQPLLLITGVDITERKRNAEDLRASRARLVRAEDMARRALERNLHDGAQQRLVALSVALRLVEARLHADPDAALELLTDAQAELAQALSELRELARGIHPAVLTDRGLKAALETLAARSPVPVSVDAPIDRLPPDVEATAYYVVAESLTNVVRYARASSARITVRAADSTLVVRVSDDGIGGADPAAGSGLRGLADRVAVLDGTLTVTSPRRGGTTVTAEIPIVE